MDNNQSREFFSINTMRGTYTNSINIFTTAANNTKKGYKLDNDIKERLYKLTTIILQSSDGEITKMMTTNLTYRLDRIMFKSLKQVTPSITSIQENEFLQQTVSQPKN